MFDGSVESTSFTSSFYESLAFWMLRYDSINNTLGKEEDRILAVKAGITYSETCL